MHKVMARKGVVAQAQTQKFKSTSIIRENKALQEYLTPGAKAIHLVSQKRCVYKRHHARTQKNTQRLQRVNF